MFERYTEQARRVVFFARYEASQFGSASIETEHLLLGLTREAKDLFTRFVRAGGSMDSIREEIESRTPRREKTTTSIDLPLTNQCKRILANAGEESQQLNHGYIGTEHMLLGVLRDETCLAAQVLHNHGVQLQSVREELRREPMPKGIGAFSSSLGSLRAKFAEMGVGLLAGMRHNPVLPKNGVIPDADTAIRIAEAIWIPLYGVDTVESQRPTKAELKARIVWFVTGSATGGGAEPLSAFILKADGRILAIGRELEGPKKDE